MRTSRFTFIAGYDGKCADCDEEILIGDEVAYFEDELMCSDCWQDARKEARESARHAR